MAFALVFNHFLNPVVGWYVPVVSTLLLVILAELRGE